jgi:hypothetical protein
MDACGREMWKRLNLRIAGQLFALGFLLTACEPSINVSGEQAFENSLAEAKRSLSPTDRNKLENAIFALGMKDVALCEGTPWHISLSSRCERIFGRSDLVSELSGKMPGPYRTNLNVSIIIPRAIEQKLNIDDPLLGLTDRLVAATAKELRKIVNRELEIVTLTDDCRGVPPAQHILIIFIKNETPWPITRIKFSGDNLGRSGTGYHDFHPNLEPGGTSKELEIRGTAACTSVSLDTVEVAGKSPFTPISRSKWLDAKRRLDGLVNPKTTADISGSLQKLLDWLRNIH